jgi:hypothetical protein
MPTVNETRDEALTLAAGYIPGGALKHWSISNNARQYSKGYNVGYEPTHGTRGACAYIRRDDMLELEELLKQRANPQFDSYLWFVLRALTANFRFNVVPVYGWWNERKEERKRILLEYTPKLSGRRMFIDIVRDGVRTATMVCGTLREFIERGFIFAEGSDTVSDTSSETFNDFFAGLSERMRSALIDANRGDGKWKHLVRRSTGKEYDTYSGYFERRVDKLLNDAQRHPY